MLTTLGLLSVFAGAAMVAAQETITTVDWNNDVTLSDPTLWHTVANGPCGVAEHYTLSHGADMTMKFTGGFSSEQFNANT